MVMAVVEVGESDGVVSTGADIEDSGAESFSAGEEVLGDSPAATVGLVVSVDGASLLALPHAARSTAPMMTLTMPELRVVMAPT